VAKASWPGLNRFKAASVSCLEREQITERLAASLRTHRHLRGRTIGGVAPLLVQQALAAGATLHRLITGSVAA
jgi:hypothetical protein